MEKYKKIFVFLYIYVYIQASQVMLAGSLLQYRRCKRHRFDPWVWENPLEEGMATHSSILAWKAMEHRVKKRWT